MLFFSSPTMDPAWNLALEEFLFSSAGPASCLYLWRNAPSVIIGKFQNPVEEVDQDYLDRHGIHVFRRMTGGGAVYHDPGNLNFSIFTDTPVDSSMDQLHNSSASGPPDRKQVSEEISDAAGVPPVGAAGPGDYAARLLRPVLRAVDSFGLHAQARGRNDILLDGKKIAGCAQREQEGRLLFHGCIMIDTDLDALQNALNVSAAKLESNSIPSVRSRVTTLCAQARRPVSMQEFMEAMQEAFSKEEPLVPLRLSEDDLSEVRSLAEKKYRSWEWNYGDFPAYRIFRERKFSAGLVRASMEVSRGRIQKLRLSGDFFGSREISVLENALTGIPLDENLADRLRQLSVETYLNGIGAEDLASLLR